MTVSTPSEALLGSARRWIEATASPCRVSCGEGSVIVRSHPARLGTDLLDYVAGYFSVAPEDGRAQRVYACEHESWRREAERLWRNAEQDGTSPVRRSGRLGIARCAEEDGRPAGYALMDRRADLALLLLSAGPPGVLSMLPIRVVRAAILLQLEAAGWSYLHAACLTRGGVGLAVTGPKCAGKTTLALQLLGRPGWRLVANDKLAVRPGGAGIEARGFPIRMGIRSGSLDVLPRSKASALRLASDERTDGSRILVRPQLVASRFGTTVDRHTSLAVIVQPFFDPSVTRITLEEVEPVGARALLRSQCLPDLGLIAEQQSFLSYLVDAPLPIADPPLLECIADHVPVVKLRHGHRHGESVASMLEAVLAKHTNQPAPQRIVASTAGDEMQLRSQPVAMLAAGEVSTA